MKGFDSLFLFIFNNLERNVIILYNYFDTLFIFIYIKEYGIY